MSRRQAREIALQTLFQLDFNDIDRQTAFDAVMAEHGAVSERDQKYAWELIDGTLAHQGAIDEMISRTATDWRLDRLAGVDRNIARIAIYEMEFGLQEISPSIVINEAVELAKTFGTDDSSRFINGILGSLARRKEISDA